MDYSPSKGAVGLILNRPTQFTLESISFDITSPTEEGSQDADGNPTAEETRAMREQEELEDQGNSEVSQERKREREKERERNENEVHRQRREGSISLLSFLSYVVPLLFPDTG